MKISIWQQFSSNHSMGFTLVGTFPSERQAYHAAQIFADRYEAEWRYWLKIDQESKRGYSIVPTTLKEFEKLLSKHLVVHRNAVFLSNIWETWMGHYPYSAYIKSKDGGVAVTGEMEETDIMLKFKVKTQNPEHAESMLKVFNAGAGQADWEPPWNNGKRWRFTYWEKAECSVYRAFLIINDIRCSIMIPNIEKRLTAMEDYFIQEGCVLNYEFYSKKGQGWG